MKNKLDELVAMIREQAAQLEALSEDRIDQITLSDVDKAYRQFRANVERATADADRRFENDQMFF
jgi:hypothetical protein